MQNGATVAPPPATGLQTLLEWTEYIVIIETRKVCEADNIQRYVRTIYSWNKDGDGFYFFGWDLINCDCTEEGQGMIYAGIILPSIYILVINCKVFVLLINSSK